MKSLQHKHKLYESEGEMMEDLYFIVNRRHNQNGHFFTLWGKNRNGYVIDMTQAGLYTKEETLNILSSIHFDDSAIKLSFLELTPEEVALMSNRKLTSNVIPKVDSMFRHIKQQETKFKLLMKARVKK